MIQSQGYCILSDEKETRKRKETTPMNQTQSLISFSAGVQNTAHIWKEKSWQSFCLYSLCNLFDLLNGRADLSP